MTGVEVRVLTHQIPMGIELQFVNIHGDGGYSVLTFGQVQTTYVSPEDAPAQPPDHASLRIQPEYARALYEALAEHFGHTPQTIGALRKDYEAERRRVDQLTETVIRIAERPHTTIVGGEDMRMVEQ